MPDSTEIINRNNSTIVPVSEAVVLLAPLLDAIPRIDEAGDEAIVKRILLAETLDAVFAPLETEGFETLVDTPIRITAIRWGESDFDGGLGVYMIVEAVKPDGEKIVTTTGSATCMVQLAKAHALGQIPGIAVVPRKAKKPTKRGYFPFNLELCGE